MRAPTYKLQQETSSKIGRPPHFPAPCQWSRRAPGAAVDSCDTAWNDRGPERAKSNRKKEWQFNKGLCLQTPNPTLALCQPRGAAALEYNNTTTRRITQTQPCLPMTAKDRILCVNRANLCSTVPCQSLLYLNLLLMSDILQALWVSKPILSTSFLNQEVTCSPADHQQMIQPDQFPCSPGGQWENPAHLVCTAHRAAPSPQHTPPCTKRGKRRRRDPPSEMEGARLRWGVWATPDIAQRWRTDPWERHQTICNMPQGW